MNKWRAGTKVGLIVAFLLGCIYDLATMMAVPMWGSFGDGCGVPGG